jgi:hypothetical protein
MEFARERELVHLRYELRAMLADGRHDRAAPLLARLREIAAADAHEAASLSSEIDRWESTFRL